MEPIDILVVHYGQPELTKLAVETVASAGTSIFVYDNSGDCPEGLPARVEGDGTNSFFAAANNRLLDCGRAPWVLLLNPDVVVAPAVVRALVSRLDATSDCWGATVRLVGADGAPQNYQHGLPTMRALLADRLPPLRGVFRSAFRAYRCLDLDLQGVTRVEQPPAALLLLRRDSLQAGLFDEAYPLFFNDVDLARRMRSLGQCLYAGDLHAVHVGGASLKAAARRGEPVSRMYDEALLTYASRELHGQRWLHAAVWLRRQLDRVRGGSWA